ncbi:MAG: class I SAM-dependent methyltransferase, partial [Actinomycetota bacterium]|nr:class I SAM-dependent methyltransferase [Actinomycetota bacterium]
MLVDVRPVHRLRGTKRLDVTASLGPVLEALAEDSVDLTRLRLVCDWIQYKGNFREAVDVRPVLGGDPAGNGVLPRELELAVDLRRCGDVDLKAAVRGALTDDAPRVYLEEWKPTSTSLIWRFNALYWQALTLWEESTGRAYEQALPGGESDARNIDSVREIIGHLFEVWDDLAASGALPNELYVVELGVGNGNQARTWLDVFRRMERERGTEYYRRLHYLMCDYSPHVLELARAAVAEHSEHVSSFVLDATEPTTALGMLRYKVFLVYISNVYDNLPTDEVARIGGRVYR